MDKISTLLVAFMFITILTLGIAAILAELAEIVRGVEKRSRDRLLLGWLLLLLFAYFDLFWHTADITRLEDWDFPLFLLAETGPVLLLFGTHIAISAVSEASDLEAQEILNRSRFFLIYAFLHVWGILITLVIANGFDAACATSAGIIAVCLALSVTNNRSAHVLGWLSVTVLTVGQALLTS